MEPPQKRMRTRMVGGYLRRGNRGCGSAPNSGLRETSGARRTRGLRQLSLSTTHPALSEPWRQWRQPRLNCSSSAGTFSACCCSADPSQCARARPGTKSWGAAGASRRRTPRLLATNVVFLECCIYWVGFAFRNPPGTQPIARSEVFRYSLQKLAYTVSRTGRQVLGERRRAPN
ncbi:neuronatin isoform X2 [Rhinolophus ferrumequinum]|uniref:Neuronatin n=1 Tax=Rhinolophus ferrumequinum TaxID=59479 RepID=A0A671EX39_RHIFE|nr:neuronatin isoform X2 [Rhinolophus ferrumequinum]